MRSRILVALAFVCAFPALVHADAPVEVKAHEDAFARACEAGDVNAVLALYTDDASVIWPGQGEEAKGKAAIAKLATSFCKETKGLKLALKTLDAKSLGVDHIGTIGHWEMTSTGPDGKPVVTQVRATEILRRSGGKLQYLVDHASVGLPPAPPAGAAGSGTKAPKAPPQ